MTQAAPETAGAPVKTPLYGKGFAALLFDMDGTLINSIAAAERVWGDWARKQGLDVKAFMPTFHGKRAEDTIAGLAIPGMDIARETALVTAAEVAELDGIVAIEGAKAFLASLPKGRWAIVTSASRALAESRLAAAGLDMPEMIVTAEDVTAGKPQPFCFLLAAERLGVDPKDCLVFEDAPAGILAGERAGGEVVVVTATHAHPVQTSRAKIRDYAGISTSVDADGAIRVMIPATSPPSR